MRFLLAWALPVVLVFAWAFELTPEGIRRERQVDRSRSITRETGRKLDRTALEQMHRHKTGALIEASVRLGALASGRADDAALAALRAGLGCPRDGRAMRPRGVEPPRGG